mmetsp:Transcript_30737/g.59306  ORF Transcript_30737/g.59306 Transcript_30737/m.59306 type:complete len:336 (-) Transcript_30737:1119-2126(-)
MRLRILSSYEAHAAAASASTAPALLPPACSQLSQGPFSVLLASSHSALRALAAAPASSRSCRMDTPDSNVSTSTSECTSGGTGAGKATSWVSRKLWMNRQRFWASTRKSICATSGARNCATLSCRRMFLSPGRDAHAPTSASMMLKSRTMISCTLGWRTFTATSSPGSCPATRHHSCESTALCTCATLPEAMGSMSNWSNSAPMGWPNAASITFTECAESCVAAFICSRVSATHTSPGNKSLRVAAHCPHLMNAGPAASRVDASIWVQASRRTFQCRAIGAESRRGVKSSNRETTRATHVIASSTRPRLVRLDAASAKGSKTGSRCISAAAARFA